MKENSVVRLGGWCAILAGVFSALAGITYFLLPAAQQLGSPGNQILPSFAQEPTFLNLENLFLALVGVFGLGLVPAVAERMREVNDGWLRWTSNLANVGYAVSAVGSFIVLSRLPVIASAYVKGDASTQAALAAVWRTSLDPLGVWGYGAIGLWILVVSLAALRRENSFPTSLAYVGILAAVLHWLIPIAFVTRVTFLFLVVAGAGAIVFTAWYIWVGTQLRRA
jgi:hypothetical protein